MQACKLKGTIDPSGHLVPPGEVEVIMWPSDAKDTESRPASETSQSKFSGKKPKTQVKIFEDLFEKTQPASPDFDPEQARWEALREKYDLLPEPLRLCQRH